MWHSMIPRRRRAASSRGRMHQQAQVELWSPTVPIIQATWAANTAGAPCRLHEVAKLIVAVQRPGMESERPVTRNQSVAREARKRALQMRSGSRSTVDLARVKSVRTAEILQSLCPASRPWTAAQCPRPVGSTQPGRGGEVRSNGSGHYRADPCGTKPSTKPIT